MKKVFSIIAMLTVVTVAMAQPRAVDGDVNGDGNVTSADITVLYNYLLNGDTSELVNGDVTGDGHITSNDVTYVYNIFLGIPNPINHEYVDLGLPSGTLWATMNIGANNPEECGDYFSWGETTAREVEDPYWNHYQWSVNKWNTITKYCINSSHGSNGFADNLTELEPEDDTATVNWGPDWQMPSKTQMEELRTKCTWQWTTKNGVKGYMVKSKNNGNSMFLPVTDYYSNGEIHYTGNLGYYWSRTLHETTSYKAYYLFFYTSSNLECTYGNRYSGYAVRAVRTQTY